MTFWLLALLSCSQAQVLRTDELVRVGTGGRVQLLKSEHRGIRLEKETVWMEIWPTHYIVTADFMIVNHGPAQNVRLGFPESGGGETEQSYNKFLASHTSFHWFAMWVDDRPVKAKRTVFENGSIYYAASWIKTLSFGAGQKRHLRVRYRSRVGGEASSFDEGGFHNLYYDFRDNNWRSNVKQTTLTAIVHGDKIHIADVYPGNVPDNVRRRGRWMRYFWKNWKAADSWMLVFKVPKHQ